MRGVGMVLVGFGVSVMLAVFAYGGMQDWHANAPAVIATFVAGNLVSFLGASLHARD